MEASAASDSDNGQGGASSSSESSARKKPQTVSCFLCGGTQIYPGPRYENHLMNEHGVLDIDYMIAITLYKQEHGSNPSLEAPGKFTHDTIVDRKNDKAESTDEKIDVATSVAETQTDLDIICVKCTEPVECGLALEKEKLDVGNLRVKHEFKLKVQSNGHQNIDQNDNEDGLDDEDIDEDEERFAAVLAAAEDTDDDDEGQVRSSSDLCEESSPNSVATNYVLPKNIGLSTDMRCYFGCDELFKKDYELQLHLKLKHNNADPNELKRAYQAAADEIALTKRSGSTFQCAICPKTYNDPGAFNGHIRKKHNMPWKDYKVKYGPCEVESAPFECKICGRVLKYSRNTIHTHLRFVHRINWAIYLDRIRKMRHGEPLDDLPSIQTFECRVCNISVKYLREHLKNVHKLTEAEYDELFKDERLKNQKSINTANIQNEYNQDIKTERIEMQQKPQDEWKPDRNSLPRKHNVSVDAVSDCLTSSNDLPKPPKSDFQDKTNKTCSSCTITFDSRRSFIEHSTTVHNINFRTKSGVAISAETFPLKVKQEQQTLKRKLDEKEMETIQQGCQFANLISQQHLKELEFNIRNIKGEKGINIHSPSLPPQNKQIKIKIKNVSDDVKRGIKNGYVASEQYDHQISQNVQHCEELTNYLQF